MSAKVERGAFTRWCHRCGWKGTYDTAGRADYCKRRHSCERSLRKTESAERAQARKAAVDRTPKPCLHKQANHQHGTRAAYVLDRCRCWPCAKANAAAEQWRERQKAYGRYDKYVPAELVRDHLEKLREYGIGLKKVSELSGVSNGSLTKIVYGTYASTGRGHERRLGEGELLRGPARRVQRSTAERIFTVEAVPANLGARQSDHERTPTARLHMRALVALGWSMSLIGARLGMEHRGNVCRMITGDFPLARETVDRIEALYGELCMTLPPATNQRERISVSRSRRYAKQHGWLPPLALDEYGDAESETDGPYLDEAAIYRRMHGDKSVRLSKDDATELVQRWVASGRSLAECERVTGIKTDRFYRLKDHQERAS